MYVADNLSKFFLTPKISFLTYIIVKLQNVCFLFIVNHCVSLFLHWRGTAGSGNDNKLILPCQRGLRHLPLKKLWVSCLQQKTVSGGQTKFLEL